MAKKRSVTRTMSQNFWLVGYLASIQSTLINLMEFLVDKPECDDLVDEIQDLSMRLQFLLGKLPDRKEEKIN